MTTSNGTIPNTVHADRDRTNNRNMALSAEDHWHDAWEATPL